MFLLIFVKSISPGVVDTELIEQNGFSQVPGLGKLKCIDVADAILFALGAPQHVNVSLYNS